jgi:hypothetical protein
MSADAGAPAFSVGSAQSNNAPPSAGPLVPGQPATTTLGPRTGFNWMKLLPLGALLAIAVIAFALIGGLNLGGPATASDGSFSVKNPGGWYPTTFSVVQGKRVVLSLQAQKAGGTSEFAVADFGQQVPLDLIPAAWEQMQASGQYQSLGRLGGMTSTTVGGAPAMAGTIDGTQYSGQLLFIDYNRTTYILAIVSTKGTFSQMRNSDFATMLSSWTWLH